MLDQIFTWNTLWWVLLLTYVPLSLGLVTLVLLQQGKGGGLGGALGAGGGDNVFGAKSAQTMPVKLTYIGAGCFLVLAIALSLVSGRTTQGMAPELAPETSDSATDDSSVSKEGLDALGIGTGVIDNEVHNGGATVPPVEIPAEVPAETPDETPVSEEVSTDATATE